MLKPRIEALVAWLQAQAAATAGARCIVYLAGVPAAGKSTLAAELEAALPQLQALPMDGFHLPNAELERRRLRVDGELVPLRRMKGAPESFDLAALREHLERLRAGEALRWPRYDRQLHEPVPSAIDAQATGICLVEGNYLLLDEPGWRELRPLAERTMMLMVAAEQARRDAIARHMRGGRGRADAERHYACCDARNRARILRHRLPADLLVERS